MPLNGSLSNRTPANQRVTRGQLARALSSVHFGQSVSLEKAVAFMYEAGITTGKKPSAGKTLENFSPNDKLQRAHIVAFMHRYHTYLQNNPSIKLDSLIPIKNQSTQQVVTNIVPSRFSKEARGKVGLYQVSGLKVRHGFHTYGNKTQAEYDKVMEIIDEAMEGYEDINYAGEYAEYHDAYLDGKRGIHDRRDPNFNTKENRGLLIAERRIGYLLDLGISLETVKDIWRLSYVSSSLVSGTIVPEDGAPESAYDGLVRGVQDCDTWAQIRSAVFDAAGYNTMILSVPGHAAPFAEIEGQWFNIEFASIFIPVDIEKALSTSWSDHTPATY